MTNSQSSIKEKESLSELYPIATPLDEGDAENRRDDSSWALEEDCYCCREAHPNPELFEANWDGSDVCFDCNFDNCQKPLYWIKKIKALEEEAHSRKKILAEIFKKQLPTALLSKYGYPDEWNHRTWAVHLKATEWREIIADLEGSK